MRLHRSRNGKSKYNHLYEFNFNCSGTAFANGTCSWGSTVSCNSPQNSYETPVYTTQTVGSAGTNMCQRTCTAGQNGAGARLVNNSGVCALQTCPMFFYPYAAYGNCLQCLTDVFDSGTFWQSGTPNSC